MRLASILLVALLIAGARAAAEGASEPSLRSTGAVHGAATDEAGAEHDVGQSAAAIEKSGSSAPEGRTKPIDPAQHGLLPFIILKSIERPFMMSPPR